MSLTYLFRFVQLSLHDSCLDDKQQIPIADIRLTNSQITICGAVRIHRLGSESILSCGFVHNWNSVPNWGADLSLEAQPSIKVFFSGTLHNRASAMTPLR